MIMADSEFKPGNERLKEAVMLILNNTERVEDLGMKKLAKLLYFADFNHYSDTFESITRETYERFDHGPMPASLYDAIEQLEAEGRIQAEKSEVTEDIEKWDFEVGQEFEPRYLPVEHQEHILKTLDKLDHMSANQLEELSHRDTPWQVTEDRDDIDYTLVFYRDSDIEELFE